MERYVGAFPVTYSFMLGIPVFVRMLKKIADLTLKHYIFFLATFFLNLTFYEHQIWRTFGQFPRLTCNFATLQVCLGRVCPTRSHMSLPREGLSHKIPHEFASWVCFPVIVRPNRSISRQSSPDKLEAGVLTLMNNRQQENMFTNHHVRHVYNHSTYWMTNVLAKHFKLACTHWQTTI